MKNLYTENCKTLKKETKELRNKKNISNAHDLKKLILLKCQTTPNNLQIK